VDRADASATHPGNAVIAFRTGDAQRLVAPAGAGALDVGATHSTPPNAAAAAGADGVRRAAPGSRLLPALVVWDALVPAVLLALTGRFAGALGSPVNNGAAGLTDPLVLLLAAICPLGLAIAGAYDPRRRRDASRLLFALKLGVVAMVVSWVALVSSAVAGWPVDVAQMLVTTLVLPLGWLVGRWACDRHPSGGPEHVLLVGSGVMAARVMELTNRHRERGLVIVGRVEPDALPVDGSGPPVLGSLDDLPIILTAHQIDRVIVAFAEGRDSELLDVLRLCVANGVQVDVVPRFFDLVGPAPRAHSIGGLALVAVPGGGLSRSQRVLKRTLDIAGSLTLIVALLPAIAAIAAAIAVRDGRPVLFRQRRIGQHGRPFSIVKFRTMSVGSETEGSALRATTAQGADPQPGSDGASISTVVRELKATTGAKVTRIGAVLRATSLDELPQLFNVLRGDMSLVGPRPLRPFEVSALSPWQLARQDLRPGLTGLWQVLGRSNIDWDERMQLDYSYVSHWSLASDLQILARTLPAVVHREGAV
jgi:exopolysaccharide biosynthesis polyprenyl glycosylphosphotransferase